MNRAASSCVGDQQRIPSVVCFWFFFLAGIDFSAILLPTRLKSCLTYCMIGEWPDHRQQVSVEHRAQQDNCKKSQQPSGCNALSEVPMGVSVPVAREGDREVSATAAPDAIHYPSSAIRALGPCSTHTPHGPLLPCP